MSEPIKSILVEGKTHVNVDATVQQIKRQLQSQGEVEYIAKKYEISRVGLIIKQVEEATKCVVKKMHTDNTLEPGKEGKDVRVLSFRVVFSNKK